MILYHLDRLFEEAGRSPESYNKLLKRLQRSRKICIISIVVLALVALALCLLAFISIMSWLHSPTFPMPSPVDWLVSSLSPSLIYTISASFFVGLALDFGFMLHNDVCIKMLIFMRALQASPITTDGNTCNAPPP